MTRKSRRAAVSALAVGVLAVAAACGGSGFNGKKQASNEGGGGGSQKAPLTLLFGSSGTAETKAIQAAAAAYTKKTGIKVTAEPSQNQVQQLSQGFAANKPPDVFYLDPGTFQDYAKRGSLDAYAGKLPFAKDFYPAEIKAFTYKGKFYCAPKDGSSLALVINTDDWKQAGLTDADVPKTWDQLEQVAKKLTTHGRVGLTLDPTHSEFDAFFYQNGGMVLNDTATKADIDSPQNVQALTFIKKLLTAGIMKYPSQLDASWNGEAFGKNKAAMTYVGSWLGGAMETDFPSIKYKVYPLPAGPKGKGTVTFTNCWGIPATGAHTAEAEKFVRFLLQGNRQLAFARAFGPIPSRLSVKSAWAKEFPQDAAYADSDNAHPDIALSGGQEAISDFDSRLTQLAKTDPKTLLAKVQSNLAAVISQNR